MRLDLLRHGDALAVADRVSGERPLSPRGVADLERLGRSLSAGGWRPDRVFSSPLLRARESAAVLLSAAGIEQPVETLADLNPAHGSASKVREALAERDLRDGHVLVVGHQPLLGELAHVLCGHAVPFVPAGLASLECRAGIPQGGGRLLAALVPGVDF